MLTRGDIELIALAKGRLDWSPKKNWVENAGGLPTKIEDLAIELIKKGMTRERAIATAVSRAKHWAAVSKNAKTRAKWAAVVAQWEALKAKSHAKSAAKSAVKMSNEQDGDVLMLSSQSYSMDKVNRAFSEEQRMYARDFSARNPEIKAEFIPQMQIREVWNDAVIAEDQAGKVYRARFVVTSSGDVVFGSPEEVRVDYVPMDEAMVQDMADTEEPQEPQDSQESMDMQDMQDMAMSRLAESPLLAKVLGLTKESPLEKILKL